MSISTLLQGVKQIKDAGKHWTKQESQTEQDLFAIDFINEKTGWATSMRGDIVHTNDGGRTWKGQIGIIVPLSNLYFIDLKRGWVSGPGGRLFSTSDGGKNWNEKNSGTEPDL